MERVVVGLVWCIEEGHHLFQGCYPPRMECVREVGTPDTEFSPDPFSPMRPPRAYFSHRISLHLIDWPL
jgi:hypothetical protein